MGRCEAVMSSADLFKVETTPTVQAPAKWFWSMIRSRCIDGAARAEIISKSEIAALTNV
jgi:hypothetical protein